MKQINVWFEDKEMKELKKIKVEHGGNWHDFILDIIMAKDRTIGGK